MKKRPVTGIVHPHLKILKKSGYADVARVLEYDGDVMSIPAERWDEVAGFLRAMPYGSTLRDIAEHRARWVRQRLRANPPFYAHNLYEKKTHGLNLKQMRRLYAMVSRGNQKAIAYARNVLGIPFSESPSQVKAVVLHHVRDLAERRVRRNPFRSGGYLRETPKEAGYRVISLKGRQLILEDLADGKRELWARSPNFAGYAIFYKNNTYEFVTSVLPGMTPVLPRAGQPIKGNPSRTRYMLVDRRTGKPISDVATWGREIPRD